MLIYSKLLSKCLITYTNCILDITWQHLFVHWCAMSLHFYILKWFTCNARYIRNCILRFKIPENSQGTVFFRYIIKCLFWWLSSANQFRLWSHDNNKMSFLKNNFHVWYVILRLLIQYKQEDLIPSNKLAIWTPTRCSCSEFFLLLAAWFQVIKTTINFKIIL